MFMQYKVFSNWHFRSIFTNLRLLTYNITALNKKLPISLSETAIAKILEIRESKQISSDYHLRIGVKSAGCGIASYIIGFDHANDKDVIYELDKFTVIIEKVQVMYLAGKKVDYGNAEGEIGFIFREN